MTTGPLNTQSILFGQVSKFVEIRESRLSEPIELSEVQLSEIKKIGRDLASKKHSMVWTKMMSSTVTERVQRK
jgi:hypothetical protein